MNIDQPVILSAKRTPIGKFMGGLSRTTAPQLGAHAIKGALQESGVSAAAIEEVFMGCVLQAGVGQNPARQAALGAGIPDTVTAVTMAEKLSSVSCLRHNDTVLLHVFRFACALCNWQHPLVGHLAVHCAFLLSTHAK